MKRTRKNSSAKYINTYSNSFNRSEVSAIKKGSERIKTLESITLKAPDNENIPSIDSEIVVTRRAKLHSKGHSKSVFKDPSADENGAFRMSNF